MRYDGAGPKRMHSGIMAITAIKLEDGHRPQQVRGDGGFLHQNKDHVIGKHGIEDVLGDIAPQIHAEVLAENFYPQRRTQLNHQAIEALSKG